MNYKLHKPRNKNIRNISKFKANDDDEDSLNILGNKQLGYFSQQITNTKLVIPIDEGVKDAEYYRQVVQAISNTGEDDIIQYEISSPGGSLDGLIALLTANLKTEATKVANINGGCHSAGSMLALNCDCIYVSPYATMLIHNVSYGTSGKASDIKGYVNHIQEVTEDLFRQTYELFLTEEEIQKCLDGAELWLNSKQIGERLENKFRILEELEDEAEGKPEVATISETIGNVITRGIVQSQAASELPTAEEEEEWYRLQEEQLVAEPKPAKKSVRKAKG